MVHTIDFPNLTQIQNNQSLMEEVENEEMKKLLSRLLERIGLIKSQPDLDFFQDDNDVQKTKTTATTKYSNTKVKTRNLLTNVSYRRYKPEDGEKTNFVINVFSFLTQNLNPTGLDRKLEIPLEREYGKKCFGTAVYHINSASLFIKKKILLTLANRI